MRTSIFSIALLTIICLLFGCKKEDIDTRTGLELLTDRNAENYFVFTEGKDTFVWQATKGDVIKTSGGITNSSSGQYHYASVSFTPKAGRMTKFYISFYRPASSPSANSCAVIDSLVQVGITPVIGLGGASISCTENGTLDLYSSFSKRKQSIEILSVKHIETGKGCYKLRAKIKMTKVQLKLYFDCPIWDEITGVMQVDFEIPTK